MYMAETKGGDGDASDQKDEDPVLYDEDEPVDEASHNHHTLRLASSIAVKSEIFCLAFSDDGRFLLACCGDGMVRVFNPSTGLVISVLVSKRGRRSGGDEATIGDGGSESIRRRKSSKRKSSILDGVELPCTCAVFRPIVQNREKTSGVALIGYSRGEVQLWHVPSTKLLYRQVLSEEIASRRSSVGEWSDEKEEASIASSPFGVEILCCAYSADANSFATGASDGIVRVYNDDTKELLVELKPGVARGSGHSSRIFSIKFHPDDHNIVVSGGWDDCVLVWNVETGTTTKKIFGPHVCGDSIDVVGRTILTGSWRDDSQLEIWDMDTGEASGLPFWSGHGKGVLVQASGRRCRLYAATFGGPEASPGKFIAAGGGEGANEVKVFDFFNGRRLIGSLLGLSAGAISLAFAEGGKKLAVGLSNGQVHLLDIVATTEAQTTTGGKTIMVF